jgi:ABC-2 type transport system ATP-binding protein
VDPATDAAGAASAIAVADVHKTFRGGVHALRGVTLAVAPGEIFGLLGRNGAGKTTLVKILLDLVRPTRGATRLLGVPSRLPRARRDVGYLPEDHRFPDYHTAESALGFYGGLSGLRGAPLRARAGELLARFGLANARRRKIRGFTKGMKQRLGLAQVFLAEPRLLFLDEPTDGVDPVGRAQIRGQLEELKRRGHTIFLNSHLLSEVEQLCDRVGILDQGTLVRCGTIGELTSAGARFAVAAADPIPAAVVAELGALAASVQGTADGVEVVLDDEAGIDAVVDLLRARGVRLRGLTRRRHSLEQVFLSSLRDAPPAANPGSPAP